MSSKITDKIADKFDLQKIINNVKAMVSPLQIPEANKSDPIGYCLSELNKQIKELAEHNTKQADTIAQINTLLGTLYQEITTSCKGQAQSSASTNNMGAGATQEESEVKSDKT